MAFVPKQEQKRKLERDILGKTIRRKSAIREFRKLDLLHQEESLRVGLVPLVLCPVPATRPEALIYNFLVKLQVPFTFQYEFPDIEETEETENFRPDFYLPDFNLIIEVQGSYWHTLPDVHEKDLVKTAKMEMQGKKVIWWWDWEIEQNLVFLFRRDIPELLDSTGRPVGGPAPYIGDTEEDFRAQRAREAAYRQHVQAGLWQVRDPYYSKKRLRKKGIEAIRFHDLYARPRETKLVSREFKALEPPKPKKSIWQKNEDKLLKSLVKDTLY